MPKYWVKNYFAHGRFPEVGQKQKTEKEREKERERAKVVVLVVLVFEKKKLQKTCGLLNLPGTLITNGGEMHGIGHRNL